MIFFNHRALFFRGCVIIALYVSALHASEVPHHLFMAREFVTQQASQVTLSDSPPRCYQFVNDIIASSLPKAASAELEALNKNIQAELPLSHRSPEMVPYHYFLVATYLMQKQAGNFWRAKNLDEVTAGDLLIYIDPSYNPDPSHRPPHQPSGTHVAFVDSVFTDETGEFISLHLVDSSRRFKGRSLNPTDLGWGKKLPPLKSGVGYSLLKIKACTISDDTQTLWTCKFPYEKATQKKLIFMSLGV